MTTNPVVRALSAIGAFALPVVAVTLAGDVPAEPARRTIHRAELVGPRNLDPVRWTPPTTVTIVEPEQVPSRAGRPAPRTSHEDTSPPLGGRSAGGTLACIRAHESDTAGGYRAVNQSSGASGAYQAMPGTWANYRGYPSAADAPPAVQDEWAARLIASVGTSPWAGSGC